MKGKDNFIYFDNAAATPIFPEVCREYKDLLEDNYGNPNSKHRIGKYLNEQIKKVEKETLSLLGVSCSEYRIIWTRGGTEANNLAILGYSQSFSKMEKFSIVSTKAEHSSIDEPLKHLELRNANIRWVKVDRGGIIDFDHLKESLNSQTVLVSFSLVQNETGTIQNIGIIRELLDQYSPNAKLHVDAVQGFGKVEIPLQKEKIDFLSLSSRKIHGPGNLGILIIKANCRTLRPLLFGGGQQYNLLPGTIDVPTILAFSKASMKLWSVKSELFAKANLLNSKMRNCLLKLRDKNGKRIRIEFNSLECCSPYILNFTILGYQGAVIMRMLGLQGVIVGVGSACASESKSPSRILKAMGLTDEQAYSSLRVSFGYQNSIDEVDIFISKLQKVIIDY